VRGLGSKSTKEPPRRGYRKRSFESKSTKGFEPPRGGYKAKGLESKLIEEPPRCGY
jgi:hypothetical protein